MWCFLVEQRYSVVLSSFVEPFKGERREHKTLQTNNRNSLVQSIIRYVAKNTWQESNKALGRLARMGGIVTERRRLSYIESLGDSHQVLYSSIHVIVCIVIVMLPATCTGHPHNTSAAAAAAAAASHSHS